MSAYIDLHKVSFHSDTEELVIEKLDTSVGYVSQLVVYNDDVNTFDWVIQSLMEICNHTAIQAEQVSLLVHFKGKAAVKSAGIEVLMPMKDALTERGLSAVIETHVP